MRTTSFIVWAGLLSLCAAGPGGAAESPRESGKSMTQGSHSQMAQGARTCRTVTTCREAVVLWCGGYRRADADDDGIPCENVCRSLAQVEAIRKEIGC